MHHSPCFIYTLSQQNTISILKGMVDPQGQDDKDDDDDKEQEERAIVTRRDDSGGGLWK